MTAQQRRERCEKVHIELHGDCRGCAMTDYIEALAIECENAAYERAAEKLDYRSKPPGSTFTERDCCPVLVKMIALEIRALRSEGRE